MVSHDELKMTQMSSRGFEPGSVNFDKKSNGKDKFQTKALPTELRCQVTEWSNISLKLLM